MKFEIICLVLSMIKASDIRQVIIQRGDIEYVLVGEELMRLSDYEKQLKRQKASLEPKTRLSGQDREVKNSKSSRKKSKKKKNKSSSKEAPDSKNKTSKSSKSKSKKSKKTKTKSRR